MNRAPIGFFDSGVGGLGVLAAVRSLLPDEDCVYLADQKNAPYGPQPLADVRRLSFAAADFLLAQGAKLVVVACNTASAAALAPLRRRRPGTPFVGMEPAIKPAALESPSGRIGVLATAATFRSQRYTDVARRFARGVRVWTAACPEIVEAVEAGRADDPELEAILTEKLATMRAAGVDRLVLGCTHFPFARTALERAAGPGAALIDPAPAVARRVRQVLSEMEALAAEGSAPASARTRYFTTGDPSLFSSLASRLLGGAVACEGAHLESVTRNP